MEMVQHGRHARRVGQGGAGFGRQLHGLARTCSVYVYAYNSGEAGKTVTGKGRRRTKLGVDTRMRDR